MAKSIKFRNDIYLDSASITHNQIKLNDILNYSVNPVEIGKWIDNKKKVYKKVIYSDNENADSILINFNFADMILNIYGFAIMSNGSFYFINGGNASYADNKEWFLHATWLPKTNDWKPGYIYLFPSCSLKDERITKYYLVVEYVQ